MNSENPIKQRILLVEDDTKLSKLVKDFLESQGLLVSIEPRGDRAIDRILKEDPDLLILDIMLPGLDGLQICGKIRFQFRHPILILTARGEESDELAGLELGADEYLTKPVRPQILLARIKMLLQRAQRYDNLDNQLSFGVLNLDTIKRTASWRNQQLDLTTIEYNLLYLFARNLGSILTRDQISQALYGYEWNGQDRSIDLCISRLRKKLGDDGKNPQRIISVRSLGYMLVVEE